MYPPLVVDEKDDKWLLLKIILKFFETRTTKKELRKYGVSASFGDKNRLNLDVLLYHGFIRAEGA